MSDLEACLAYIFKFMVNSIFQAWNPGNNDTNTLNSTLITQSYFQILWMDIFALNRKTSIIQIEVNISKSELNQKL